MAMAHRMFNVNLEWKKTVDASYLRLMAMHIYRQLWFAWRDISEDRNSDFRPLSGEILKERRYSNDG